MLNSFVPDAYSTVVQLVTLHIECVGDDGDWASFAVIDSSGTATSRSDWPWGPRAGLTDRSDWPWGPRASDWPWDPRLEWTITSN